MVSTVHNMKIGGQEVAVDVTTIPTMSETTQAIFAQLRQQLPKAETAPSSLTRSVQSLNLSDLNRKAAKIIPKSDEKFYSDRFLNEDLAALALARQNRISDRVGAVTAVVALTALLAAAIALTVLIGPAGLALLVPVGIGFLVLSLCHLRSAFPKMNWENGGLGAGIVAGMIMPFVLMHLAATVIRSAFNRVHDLEQVVRQGQLDVYLQKQSAESYINQCRSFYAAQSKTILGQLDTAKNQAEQQLADMQQHPFTITQGEEWQETQQDAQRLREELANIEAARREISQMNQFLATLTR